MFDKDNIEIFTKELIKKLNYSIKLPMFEDYNLTNPQINMLKKICNTDHLNALDEESINYINAEIKKLFEANNITSICFTGIHNDNLLYIALLMKKFIGKHPSVKKFTFKSIAICSIKAEAIIDCIENTAITEVKIQPGSGFNSSIKSNALSVILKGILKQNINKLFFKYVVFEDEQIEEIGKIVTLSKVNGLYINNCELDDRKVELLLKGIKRSKISFLDLTHNKITDAGAKQVAGVIKDTSVHSLKLSYNKIGNIGAIALIETRVLYHLALEGNHNINDKTAEVVSPYIANSNILNLNLRHTSITDNGSNLLANAISNTQLICFSIDSNKTVEINISHAINENIERRKQSFHISYYFAYYLQKNRLNGMDFINKSEPENVKESKSTQVQAGFKLMSKLPKDLVVEILCFMLPLMPKSHKINVVKNFVKTAAEKHRVCK